MPVIALVTHPELRASDFARTLVEERLAACVNILPGMQSVYRWEGKIETSPECLLMIKSDQSRLAELQKKVLELHPYEVPEFIVIEADAISDKYARWLMDSVKN